MKRIACVAWKSSDASLPGDVCESLLLACGQRFSPLVGFEPSEERSLLLDLTGLAHLFGGEPALASQLLGEIRGLGFTSRMAITDTVGAAWAAVQFRNAECVIVPPGELRPLLFPLPVEALRLPEETLHWLHELGLFQVGQVESLPHAELPSRFGPILLTRLDQAFGRLDEPVQACPPPPQFEARWLADYPLTSPERIDAELERLVHRVAGLLKHCGRGALRVECRLNLERPRSDSPTPSITLGFGLFRPTADAMRLLELLRLQFERARIPSPVTGASVVVTLSESLETRHQATLFESGDEDQREPQHIASLAERLSSRLGRDAVVGVRLRPEAQPELAWHYDPLVGDRRRRRISKKNEDLPPRPVRMLQRPVLLSATAVAPDGPPGRFHFAGRDHTIVRHWGPERIEAGWWRGQPVGRDYFQVETRTGGRYWLFRRLRDGKWFLHGIFE